MKPEPGLASAIKERKMEYRVVFEIEKAHGCCPAVQEVVTLNACGTINQWLFQDVRRIIKKRTQVHELVRKWAQGGSNLGFAIKVYRHDNWVYGIKV